MQPNNNLPLGTKLDYDLIIVDKRGTNKEALLEKLYDGWKFEQVVSSGDSVFYLMVKITLPPAGGARSLIQTPES